VRPRTGAGAAKPGVGGVTRRAALVGALAGVGALGMRGRRAAAAAAPRWRLADAVAPGGDAAYLWIDVLPPAPGGPADAIDVEIDGASPRRLAPATAGAHRLDGLRPGASALVRWRVAGPGGAGRWSERQTVSPSRADDFRFVCWADGADHTPVSVVAKALSAPAAQPSDDPIRLDRAPGDGLGGELFFAGAAGPLVVAFNRARAPEAPDPLPPLLRRHFEPLGCFNDLAPCEGAEVSYWTDAPGGPVERRFLVLGAAGMASTVGVAAVGLDADGDPVSFRFDRPVPLGRLPDGRPFAVGPLRLLRNGGPPVAVDPRPRGYEVVARDGAQLCVLAREGVLPPPGPTLTPDLAADYVRHARPHDFAADGWDERAAAAAPSDDLTLSPSWESVAVYLDSVAPEAALARFRKRGAPRFHPALPLLHDDRDPATFGWRWNPEADGGAGAEERFDASSIVPGRHRRTIRHLAPDTEYEVEILQGGRVWRALTRTKGYKPAKVSAPLGVVAGDVVITRRGGVTTVTRAGLPDIVLHAPPEVHVELHSGVVRGGRILVDAPKVLLRDVDCWGAPENAIEIGDDSAADLRLVRCRGACWGWATTPATGFENGVGFARLHSSWLSVPQSVRAVDGVLAIGCHVGAPRFSANTWQELDSSFLPRSRMMAVHPDGANAIGIRGRGFVGRGWNVRDSVFRAVDDRLYDDSVRGGGNKSFDGGVGCEVVFAYNAVGGAADDTIEFEGANVCNLVLGNFFDQTRLRRWTSAPLYAVGCGAVVWGPLECERNRIHFGAFAGPENDREPPQRRAIYKLDRDNDGEGRNGGADAAGAALRGWFVAYHDLATRDPGVSVAQSVIGVGHPIIRAIGENNVYVADAPFHNDLQDRERRQNLWGASNFQVVADDAFPPLAADGPWWDAAAVEVAGVAAPLPNVNDGGPWGAGRRDKGAVAPP